MRVQSLSGARVGQGQGWTGPGLDRARVGQGQRRKPRSFTRSLLSSRMVRKDTQHATISTGIDLDGKRKFIDGGLSKFNAVPDVHWRHVATIFHCYRMHNMFMQMVRVFGHASTHVC